MMTRIVALILVPAALLVGCGGQSGSTPTPLPAATATVADPAGPSPAATPAPSRDLAAHFAGKTVTIQVGFAPGGTHDLYSRLLAVPLSRILPGNPRLVVVNTAGAGGLRGVEATMRAAPDGLTIGMSPTRFFKQEILGVDVPNFDLTTLNIIGSPTFGRSVRAWNVRSDVAKTWDEVVALGRPVTSGGTSQGSIANLGNEFIEVMGGPIRHVYGYGGSAEVLAALDRREIEATGFGSQGDVERQYPEWITNRTITPVFWWEEKPDEDYLASLGVTDLPHLFDIFSVSELEQSVFDMTVAINGMSRVYMLPDGTPDDIYAAWVAAFEAAVEDPEFTELSVNSGADPPALGTAGDIRAILDTALGMTPEQLEIFRAIAGES